QKVTSIKTQFLDSAFCNDFVYYIPFEFKIGDANYQNDSCISIVYPGKKAEIFQNSNGVRIFQFESAYFLEKEELLKIDSLLLTGFNPYIKTKKSGDRKSTRLNSHVKISYAVFCLKKKTMTPTET